MLTINIRPCARQRLCYPLSPAVHPIPPEYAQLAHTRGRFEEVILEVRLADVARAPVSDILRLQGDRC